ncbi:MAG: type II toxin-antitoxin system TacA family antitoxin [Rhodanobacter sp.]
MNLALSIRIPAAELALIDRAAAVDQRSRTEFMRAASISAAEEVLLTRKLVRLNPEAFEQFSAAMDGPAEVSAEMLRAFTREAPWKVA